MFDRQAKRLLVIDVDLDPVARSTGDYGLERGLQALGIRTEFGKGRMPQKRVKDDANPDPVEVRIGKPAEYMFSVNRRRVLGVAFETGIGRTKDLQHM